MMLTYQLGYVDISDGGVRRHLWPVGQLQVASGSAVQCVRQGAKLEMIPIY